MKQSSNTVERIAAMLERMRTAMPDIRRQIAVYEKNLKLGKTNDIPKITVLSKNV